MKILTQAEKDQMIESANANYKPLQQQGHYRFRIKVDVDIRNKLHEIAKANDQSISELIYSLLTDCIDDGLRAKTAEQKKYVSELFKSR